MRTSSQRSWPETRSPGSRATSFHTCQVLRPRRVVRALALTRPSVLPSAQCTASASQGCCFRGSIPSLCAPLSTLHQNPRGFQRMTRGQCGSLHLHWKRLALLTPCRSPGARIVNLSGRGMLIGSVARQLGSGNSFDRLLSCPAQAERGRKRRPESINLTMRAPGDRQGVKSASLCQ